MGIFKRNFDKPGPGVEKDAPRKKGIPRFFEVLVRDMSNLVKLNLLYQICILPAQLIFGLALLTGPQNPLFLLWIVLGIAVSFPVGPASTAVSFCITRMLRDDPGFIWHDFKRIFKENFKSTMVFGMIYAAVLFAQVFALYTFLWADPGALNLGMIQLGLFMLSVLMFSMLSPYYFIQSAYLDLNTTGVLKNSVFLAFGFMPRSFMGALFSVGIWFLFIMNIFAASLPILILGYTIPRLLTLMWVWPPVNKTFGIEETLEKRMSEQIDDFMDEK